MKRVRGWRGCSHLGTRYPFLVPLPRCSLPLPFSPRALDAYIDQLCGYAKVSFVGGVSNNKKNWRSRLNNDDGSIERATLLHYCTLITVRAQRKYAIKILELLPAALTSSVAGND